MPVRSIRNEINEQIERARIAALRNRPDIPEDDAFLIEVEVRLWTASWPGTGPKGRSRSRVLGHASCAYVPKEATDGTD